MNWNQGRHLPDAGVLLPRHALDLLRGERHMLIVPHLQRNVKGAVNRTRLAS